MSSLKPLMDYAVDLLDKQVLARLTELLQGSIAHQFQHHGESAFKSGVEIARVLRVENFPLWTKYQAHLEQVKSDLSWFNIAAGSSQLSTQISDNLPAECGHLDSSVAKCMLFHGTDYESAVQIAVGGFDFRLSKPGYYGQGTYFASQACKSHQCTTKKSSLHTILLSRVILGDVAFAEAVDKDRKIPPKHPGIPRCVDTVVAKPGPMPGHHNGQQAHEEYVIFEKYQAYPECIIQYRCR
ncbi:PARP12 [Symbiodinium natans]|uniref:Poly [ADP-ribose] polymerase n=1 Tax=Symbiodinium natans TaxID=878477 RepID=A0A812S8K0_9DINO|nr:PARP12 [Symbiodinium natans]